MGSEKMSTPRYLVTPVNFGKISIFDANTPSIRKVNNGREKIITEIEATVVAS